MAAKRRGGGGFRPPELRGTLGTLLRTALHQAEGVRDALERGAREGRSRLDEYRADRRRQDALAELGEIVLDLLRRGEIDLGELPEARSVIHELDALDAEAEADTGGRDADYAAPPARRRFDDRAPGPRRFDDRAAGSRRADARAPGPRHAADASDGTVGSGARWAPPRPAAPQRVWRPPVDDEPVPAEEAAATLPRLPAMPRHPHRGGGITFEDDDLADYMHPDDVPAKDPSGSDS